MQIDVLIFLNYNSKVSAEAWIPVEIPISGLNTSFGDVFYTSVTPIDVSLATGTRVNFTCMVDHIRNCSDWNITWENNGGMCQIT